MAGIEVKHKINTKRMSEDMLKRVEAALRKKSVLLASQIRTRTGSGLNANGAAFVKYSPAYAARKGGKVLGGKKGEKYKSKNTTRSGNLKVTLRDTGRMLSSITSDVKRVGQQIIARIFFSSGKEAIKAKAHNEGLGRMPKRKFFELSNKQKGDLRSVLRQSVKKK